MVMKTEIWVNMDRFSFPRSSGSAELEEIPDFLSFFTAHPYNLFNLGLFFRESNSNQENVKTDSIK